MKILKFISATFINRLLSTVFMLPIKSIEGHRVYSTTMIQNEGVYPYLSDDY